MAFLSGRMGVMLLIKPFQPLTPIEFLLVNLSDVTQQWHHSWEEVDIFEDHRICSIYFDFM